MELIIAGGVGEHGRNCFYVRGDGICFLVDCGKMADTPDDPYPHLTPEQIGRLDAVFLTHSHADHTGALPWLYGHGFHGRVIASEETLRQLPFKVKNIMALENICPAGSGRLGDLSIQWGRTGHCAGSVWYHFAEGGKSVFFSGDYTEDTQVYACDPIRGRSAGLAVLDCAYGMDETPYDAACGRLVSESQRLLAQYGLLLFPVPKYGRGLELLKLFSDRLKETVFYGDDLFLSNLSAQSAGGFWYRPVKINAAVLPYGGQTRGIVFVSDPQLRAQGARDTAEKVLSLGGRAVMTGTLEKGSYSQKLFGDGQMELLRYPVHLDHAQFESLKEKNDFTRTVAYHSKDFTDDRVITF